MTNSAFCSEIADLVRTMPRNDAWMTQLRVSVRSRYESLGLSMPVDLDVSPTLAGLRWSAEGEPVLTAKLIYHLSDREYHALARAPIDARQLRHFVGAGFIPWALPIVDALSAVAA